MELPQAREIWEDKPHLFVAVSIRLLSHMPFVAQDALQMLRTIERVPTLLRAKAWLMLQNKTLTLSCLALSIV